MRTVITELKQRLDARNNPYFVALRDGSMSREDFMETQVQFLHAVVFFSRPMAALAARLPRPEQRFSLLENVLDEHGKGDSGFTHEQSFLELLHRFGVEPSEIEKRALWPELRAFNTTLTGLCLNDDVLTGVAAMGIIEDLFSGISAWLGQGIVARGWLSEPRVVHYATHEALDVLHAEGFYKVLEPYWAKDAWRRYQITQGLELGGYVFMRLYEDLYRNRARRWSREVSGAHSQADGWHLA